MRIVQGWPHFFPAIRWLQKWAFTLRSFWEGSVSLVRGSPALGEELEALLEPIGDLAERHRRRAGCGELDCQGQAVERSTDLDDLPTLCPDVGGLEARVGGSPLGEQLDRCTGRREWADPHDLFAVDVQWFATGGEHVELR